MFKLINGYTKKDVIWYLETFNNGTRSYDTKNKVCMYQHGDNHCAVGCFIPHGHLGMRVDGDADMLLNQLPSLEKYMPLSLEGMMALQKIHDANVSMLRHFEYKYSKIKNVKKRMIQWVKDNVEE